MDFDYSHDQSVTPSFKEQFSNDLMKSHPKFHPKSTHKDRVMTGLKIQFCPGGLMLHQCYGTKFMIAVLFSSRNDGSITPTAGSAEVVPICTLKLDVPIEAAVFCVRQNQVHSSP